jgi:Wiskott-Aldrich syndrome protein
MGDYKVIVVRAVDGTREAVLSEKSPWYQDALQTLFVKSAEAVQNYIASNGFAFVSSIGKQTTKQTGGHESDTDSSSTVLSECESLSDGETVSVTSVGRLKKRRGRKAGKSGKAASSTTAELRQPRARARSPSVSPSRARSRSSSSSSSDDELHYSPPTLPSACAPHGGAGGRTLPPWTIPTTPWPLPKASSAVPAAHPPPPPPPPPPQPTSPGGNPSSGSGTTPARPPPPSFIPPKPPVVTRASEPMLCPPPSAARYNHTDSAPSNGTNHTGNFVPRPPSITPFHDVILAIRWRDQGGAPMLVLHQMSRLSMTSIRDAALAEVRRQPNTGVYRPGQAPGSISPLSNVALSPRLRAAVKAMVLDGTEYGLTGWTGDDLTRLVALLSRGITRNSPAGGGYLPKFEVEVWEDGRMTTAPMPVPDPMLRTGPWMVAGGRGYSAEKSMQQPGNPRVHYGPHFVTGC